MGQLQGEPSGQGEETSLEGLGGHHRLPQTDARCPAGEVVCQHLDGQPGGVGGETARGKVVEAYAVLEIADGVLGLGVAAMVGLQVQGVARSVGDEGVIAVVGEERQLGVGRGLDPADDETHGCGVGLILEGSVSCLSHVSGVLHPVWNGRPVLLGNVFDGVAHTGVLADGDGVAYILLRQTATMAWV